MAEGGFDVGNVAAVVISLLSMHCFIPALHLQSLYTLYTFISYIPLYLTYLYTLYSFLHLSAGLRNMTWSLAVLHGLPTRKITKLKTTVIVCKPLAWHSSMAGRWGARGTCPGWVLCPTWPGDKAEPWPHDCEITSGTQQRWLQVQTAVAGWADGGKNPEEFENLLKKRNGWLSARCSRRNCTRNSSSNEPEEATRRDQRFFFGVM